MEEEGLLEWFNGKPYSLRDSDENLLNLTLGADMYSYECVVIKVEREIGEERRAEEVNFRHKEKHKCIIT